MKTVLKAIPPVALAFAAAPALAAPAPVWGAPVDLGDGVTFDPIVDLRLRYEHVDQNIANDADAVTARLRAGAELKFQRLSLLAEAEGTLAISNNYNAIPGLAGFDLTSNQFRPTYPVVADPENVELNRLQVQYKSPGATVTLGRQRINLDDQRWVGSVGWRQNDQTFDAVRAEAKFGPVNLDGTYSISQRSIFGIDSAARQAMDGEFFFAGAGVKAGPVNVKGFAYLLDYDTPEEAYFVSNSSKTYGLRASTVVPVTKAFKFSLNGSYARQSDYGSSPRNYEADYISADAGASFIGLGLAGGWEKLGSDNGFAVQTPMATLHKFNGFADRFLATPADGLEDAWGSVSYAYKGGGMLPAFTASVIYHQFDSDVGNVEYGTEWDAVLGFKIRGYGVTAKYANYDRVAFGADTEIVWLQTDFVF